MVRAKVLTPLYEKKRELEAEIVSLKSQCEVNNTKAKGIAEQVTDLNETFKKLEDFIDRTEKLGMEALEAVESVITEGVEALQQANKGVDTAIALLDRVTAEIDKKEAKLTEIEAQKKDRIKEINRENEKLEVKKRDLDIYFNRLQNKYYKLGLGELVLPEE